MTLTAVLWDIDGTLLSSGGVGARAFLDAVGNVTGTRPAGTNLDLGGRMDPEIAGALLASIGAPVMLVPVVLERLRELTVERAAQFAEHTRPLPGVAAVLERVAATPARQTVLTGNLRSVAGLKLHAAGLVPPIDPILGGFGDSGPDRVAAGRIALDQLRRSGWSGSTQTCWIVGDTPRDLACAQALGIRCALVGSGRHPAASLADRGADIVLDNLRDPTPLLDLWSLRPN